MLNSGIHMQMTELGDQRRCPLLICLQDKRTATEVDSCLDKIFLIKCKKRGGGSIPSSLPPLPMETDS